MRTTEEDRAAQERAQEAMQRTPGALGAIDGAMAYGLNWAELRESREAFAELIAATRFALGVGRVTQGLQDAFDRVERSPVRHEDVNARMEMLHNLQAHGPMTPLTLTDAGRRLLESQLGLKVTDLGLKVEG